MPPSQTPKSSANPTPNSNPMSIPVNSNLADSTNGNSTPISMNEKKKMNPMMIIAIVVVGFLIICGIVFAFVGNRILNSVKDSINSNSTANVNSVVSDLTKAFGGMTMAPDAITQQNAMTGELVVNGKAKDGSALNQNLSLDSNFKISNLKNFNVNSPDAIIAKDVKMEGSISLGMMANVGGQVFNFPKGSIVLSFVKPDDNFYFKATVTKAALDEIEKQYPDANLLAFSLFNDKFIEINGQLVKDSLDSATKSLSSSSSSSAGVVNSNPMTTISDGSKKVAQDFLTKIANSNAVSFTNTVGSDTNGNKTRNIAVTIDHEKAKPMVAQFVKDIAAEQMKSTPCTESKDDCDKQVKMASDMASEVIIDNLKFVLDDKSGSLLGYSANLSLDADGKMMLNDQIKTMLPDAKDSDLTSITDIKLNLNSMSSYSNTAITPEVPTAPLDLTKMLGGLIGM